MNETDGYLNNRKILSLIKYIKIDSIFISKKLRKLFLCNHTNGEPKTNVDIKFLDLKQSYLKFLIEEAEYQFNNWTGLEFLLKIHDINYHTHNTICISYSAYESPDHYKMRKQCEEIEQKQITNIVENLNEEFDKKQIIKIIEMLKKSNDLSEVDDE